MGLDDFAFPVSTIDGFTQHGMTLRDWFAGQALAGMMSNENTPFSADVAEVDPIQLAGAVYEIADAMLVARSAALAKAVSPQEMKG
jgi:hypothetical protein